VAKAIARFLFVEATKGVAREVIAWKSAVGRFGSLPLLTAVAGSMVIACSGSEVPHGKSNAKVEAR
jgi:hypothetical protein